MIYWHGKEVYRRGAMGLNRAMKTTLIALLAMGLCLPLMAADKDKEEFEKTKSKAEKGDRVAQHNLGVMYRQGRGTGQRDGSKESEAAE
jgi:TPR repeat protein